MVVGSSSCSRSRPRLGSGCVAAVLYLIVLFRLVGIIFRFVSYFVNQTIFHIITWKELTSKTNTIPTNNQHKSFLRVSFLLYSEMK